MKRPTYYLLHTTYSKKGFTIIELLIFSAIFAISSVAFIVILIAVTRIQVRQGAAAEVSGQSQFLLQTIQRYVEQSSLVEVPLDTATTTLKLRMVTSTTDPTYIYLSGGTAYLRETDAGVAVPLTSSRVTVSDLTFTKRENAGGHDSVAIAFIVAYNTENAQQKFSQALRTSIARVSAATFDSDIRASSTNTFKLGAAALEWQSINGTIFFSSSFNVGIDSSQFTPNARLHVRNGHIYLDGTVSSTNALVLRSSDGVCWRVNVNTAGTVVTASTTCP